MLQLTRRGSAPPSDSATRITGIALGSIFFAQRCGIVCLWTEISYIWPPDATVIKQNACGTAGDNRVNCNRRPRAAVYVIPPAPPGDSAGQKIALIATGLKLYRAIVRSKFDYGCIVYGTASNTNLWQLDSIHNSGLRLALGAFCTSTVSSLYTEANEAPLEECRLKRSMHYYVKTRACIDNLAHHALHGFDWITRDLYAPRPNGRGGMTRPPAPPIGLKVEEAMTSSKINAELICPLRTPNFPPGTHDYDPKRHDLIEGVSKCMVSGQEAQGKFNEFCEAHGSHDEVYTDGSKMNERVGAAAVINRHF